MSSEVTTPRLHEYLVAPSLRVLDRAIKKFFEDTTPSYEIFQAYVKNQTSLHEAFRADARRRLDEVAKSYTPSTQLSPSEKLAEQYREMKRVSIELKTHHLGCSDRSARLDDLWLIQLLFKRYGGHLYSSDDRIRFRTEILQLTDYQIMARGIESQGGGRNRTPSGTFAEHAMEYFRSIAKDPHHQILLSISEVLAAIALCRGTVKQIAPQTITPTPPQHTTTVEPHCSSSTMHLKVVPSLEISSQLPKDVEPLILSPSVKDQLSSFVDVTMKDVLIRVKKLATLLENQQVKLWEEVSPHLPKELPKQNSHEQMIVPEKMFLCLKRRELDSSLLPSLQARLQMCKEGTPEQNVKKLFELHCKQLFRYYKLRLELHVFGELLHHKIS